MLDELEWDDDDELELDEELDEELDWDDEPSVEVLELDWDDELSDALEWA